MVGTTAGRVPVEERGHAQELAAQMVRTRARGDGPYDRLLAEFEVKQDTEAGR